MKWEKETSASMTRNVSMANVDGNSKLQERQYTLMREKDTYMENKGASYVLSANPPASFSMRQTKISNRGGFHSDGSLQDRPACA